MYVWNGGGKGEGGGGGDLFLFFLFFFFSPLFRVSGWLDVVLFVCVCVVFWGFLGVFFVCFSVFVLLLFVWGFFVVVVFCFGIAHISSQMYLPWKSVTY